MSKKLTPFILLGLISTLILVTAETAKAYWYLNNQGQLVYQDDGNILGKGSGDGDEDDDDSSGSGSSGNEVKTETTDPVTGARIRTETKDGETETEIKFSETEKIKTETKDGETRTDIYSGGTKVRLETKDGRLVIKTETESGEEEELGEQDEFTIEDRAEKNQIRVATGSGESLIFARGQIAASTTFPLSVDLATNALVVTTPAGTTTVTILPDQAVQNLLAANVIDRLGPTATAQAALAGSLKDIAGVIVFGEANGLPIYQIDGLSDQKLLGLIPVTIQKTALVSAETGELIDTQTNAINTLLDLFSF